MPGASFSSYADPYGMPSPSELLAHYLFGPIVLELMKGAAELASTTEYCS